MTTATTVSTNDAGTVAWILYSVAMASGRAPAPITDISSAADAINHAVPTERELTGSLRQLNSLGLVSSQGKFHGLTPAGESMMEQAQKSSKTVAGVWNQLAQAVGEIWAGSRIGQ